MASVALACFDTGVGTFTTVGMVSQEQDDSVYGGSIPGGEGPAFTLSMPTSVPVPVLIAAPHGGRRYPGDLGNQMRDPSFAAMRLEDRHIDSIAEGVAQATGAALLVAHAPRAMLDLNRAADDMDWSMVTEGAPPGTRHSLVNRRARSGLGLVPRRLAGLGEIWKARMSRAELDARIEGIHRPYHEALAHSLERLRDRWGAALLVDLHSMPPIMPRHAHEAPIEFVVGDRFGASCNRTLVTTTFAYLEANGRQAAHNRPYAGGYVLEQHARPSRGIHAIQLEVCRSAYLDARLAEPSARAPAVVRLIAGLVRQLAHEVAVLGSSGPLLLAAE